MSHKKVKAGKKKFNYFIPFGLGFVITAITNPSHPLAAGIGICGAVLVSVGVYKASNKALRSFRRGYNSGSAKRREVSQRLATSDSYVIGTTQTRATAGESVRRAPRVTESSWRSLDGSRFHDDYGPVGVVHGFKEPSGEVGVVQENLSFDSGARRVKFAKPRVEEPIPRPRAEKPAPQPMAEKPAPPPSVTSSFGELCTPDGCVVDWRVVDLYGDSFVSVSYRGYSCFIEPLNTVYVNQCCSSLVTCIDSNIFCVELDIDAIKSVIDFHIDGIEWARSLIFADSSKVSESVDIAGESCSDSVEGFGQRGIEWARERLASVGNVTQEDSVKSTPKIEDIGLGDQGITWARERLSSESQHKITVTPVREYDTLPVDTEVSKVVAAFFRSYYGLDNLV